MNKLFLFFTILLMAGGCTLTSGVGDFTGKVVDVVRGSTAQVDNQRMEDPDFPDERRIGVNRLVKRHYGKSEPYTTRYAQIARDDPSPLVRATALRALNRSKDTSATPVFITALSDPSAMVRLEAAKALANIPSEQAVPDLIRLVRDPREEADVRIAAADALRHFKRLEVARALVAQMQERKFGISWQSRQSLKKITGADYQYDESAWLQYLSGGRVPLG